MTWDSPMESAKRDVISDATDGQRAKETFPKMEGSNLWLFSVSASQLARWYCIYDWVKMKVPLIMWLQRAHAPPLEIWPLISRQMRRKAAFSIMILKGPLLTLAGNKFVFSLEVFLHLACFFSCMTYGSNDVLWRRITLEQWSIPGLLQLSTISNTTSHIFFSFYNIL